MRMRRDNSNRTYGNEVSKGSVVVLADSLDSEFLDGTLMADTYYKVVDPDKFNKWLQEVGIDPSINLKNINDNSDAQAEFTDFLSDVYNSGAAPKPQQIGLKYDKYVILHSRSDWY